MWYRTCVSWVLGSADAAKASIEGGCVITIPEKQLSQTIELMEALPLDGTVYKMTPQVEFIYVMDLLTGTRVKFGINNKR